MFGYDPQIPLPPPSIEDTQEVPMSLVLEIYAEIKRAAEQVLGQIGDVFPAHDPDDLPI